MAALVESRRGSHSVLRGVGHWLVEQLDRGLPSPEAGALLVRQVVAGIHPEGAVAPSADFGPGDLSMVAVSTPDGTAEIDARFAAERELRAVQPLDDFLVGSLGRGSLALANPQS